MSQKLINHSPDLKRLRDEGYAITVKGGTHLFVSDIPYINGNREIKLGTLVSELDLISNARTSTPSNHTIRFIGELPCNIDGSPITAIHNATVNEQVLPDIFTNHMFSCKPTPPYADYYEKISRYSEIISAPAKAMDSRMTDRPYKVVHDEDAESVFQYSDTNSSRANVSSISARFLNQKIGIIGVGGTGSYVLDLVAKTSVKEIHLFDSDDFVQHNAFRAPGAVSNDKLEAGGLQKVIYFTDVYSNMHKGIIPHAYQITFENLSELDQMSYVFICVDKNTVRKEVMDYLLSKGIPFIDTGIGIDVVNNKLTGQLRVTSATSLKNDHIVNRVSVVDADDDGNNYSSNIQIAELNALNATLAVIKWKKMSGFYHDLIEEHDSAYIINTSQLVANDTTA